MAVKIIPDARQWPLAAYAPFSYEDALGADDAEITLFAVPLGTIFTQIVLYTTTLFGASGDQDCDIGDDTTVDRYSGTQIELDGTAGLPVNNAVVSGFTTTSAEPNLLLTFVDGTTVATAGVGYVFAQYIDTSRANENFEA